MINNGTATTNQTVMVSEIMPHHPGRVYAGVAFRATSLCYWAGDRAREIGPVRSGLGHLRRLMTCPLDRAGPSPRRATSRWSGEPAG